MSRHRSRVTAVALAAALLTAAGCGSSSKSTGSGGGGSNGGSSGAPSGSPIKIGVIEPENTQFYNAGDEVAAAKAAAVYINGKGGINGHPVQIDYCNSENDPNKTQACVRQMINDKVVAVSPAISITGPDVSTGLAKAGIPLINPNALWNEDFTSSTVYAFSGGVPTGTVAEVLAGSKAGKKKVYMVANENPFAQTFIAAAKAACNKFGLQFVGEEGLPQTAISDYAPYAQKVISSGADLVLIPLSITQAVPLIKAVKGLGSNVTFAINDGAFTNETVQQNSAATEGLLIAFAAPPYTDETAKDFPILQTFAQNVKTVADQGDKDANLDTGRSSYMIRAYQALLGTFTVMKGISGDVTASSLKDALDKAKDVDMNGIWPAWTPSKTSNIPGLGQTRVSETSWYDVVVKGGKFVLNSTQSFDPLAQLNG